MIPGVKRVVQGIIVGLAVIALQKFCHRQTEGFSISKISSVLSPRAEWETPQTVDLSVFDQPFTYLGKGAQCYVFASQDDQYVVKFLRHSHLRPRLWNCFFPKAKRERIAAAKHAKLEKDFRSYLLAFQELPQETGLLFLHLNKTDHLHKTVTLVDKLGIAHSLNLDQMEFLVQKKAELIYPAFERWIAEGKIEVAKGAIDDLFALLKKRARLGLSDKDPDLNTNFGCIDGRVIQIDVGRFKKSSPPQNENALRAELIRITDHFKQWLDQKSPDLAQHLLDKVHENPL